MTRKADFEEALGIGKKLWDEARGVVERSPEEPRYFAVNGSGSNHCCFDGTVYDRDDEVRGADGNFISFGIVCECFDMEAAERIAAALNAKVEAPAGEGRDG